MRKTAPRGAEAGREEYGELDGVETREVLCEID